MTSALLWGFPVIIFLLAVHSAWLMGQAHGMLKATRAFRLHIGASASDEELRKNLDKLLEDSWTKSRIILAVIVVAFALVIAGSGFL